MKVKKFFKGAQADTSKGKSMSPGTSASGGRRGGGRNPMAQYQGSSNLTPANKVALDNQKTGMQQSISPPRSLPKVPVIGPLSLGYNIVTSLINPSASSFTNTKSTLPKTTTPKVNFPNRDDNNSTPSLCPDGSTPPCKTPTTQLKQTAAKPSPFFSGFQAYDHGGEVVISSNVDKDLL